MKSKLQIYKASAGSGKTFTLAVEYIKLVIESPVAYKHILGVTFTNKATTEMKQRILSQLYGISKSLPDSIAYFEQVKNGLPQLTEKEIRERADMALNLIIHNYSRFRIQTIDSFFQTVIRGMARELELGVNLTVELNNEEAIGEAVDTLIEQLDQKSPILQWLLEFIQDKIDKDKGWRISDEIKRFSKNIFEEVYLEKGDRLREQLKDPQRIKNYRESLYALLTEARNTMQRHADSFFEITDSNGLSASDFYQSRSGVYAYFTKLRNNIFSNSIVNSYVRACMDDCEKWATKKSPTREIVVSLANSALHDLLMQTEAERERCNRIAVSCELSLQHYYSLRLLNRIDEEINRQNEQKNRFLLSKTTALLNKMEVGDTSFVFEKIGGELQHILIDEFQDTSRLQWKNFRMLLNETLSQGFGSLLVGDVKQAIYRWRNSDWSIFNNLEEENKNFPIEQHALIKNRRSEQHIIQFNNQLFTSASTWCINHYKENFGTESETLKKAYEDVKQETKEENKEGYVKVTFLHKGKGQEDTYEQDTLNGLVETVRELLKQGIKMSDIAILIRYNKHISMIADTFNQQLPQCPIVSNEAFYMEASVALQILINALRYLCNEEDTLSLTKLAIDYQKAIMGNNDTASILVDGAKENLLPQDYTLYKEELQMLPLYELLERLFVIFRLHEIQCQDAYLFAFFDAVNEYLQNSSGNLASFISYWDEELHGKAIPSGEVEGVRILSIHKAKGLEFHTVLIPFCDWALEGSGHNNLVWCAPNQTPFNNIDLLPIVYKQLMDESIFSDEYRREYLYQVVDNLNLLYVACTRPKNNLFIFAKSESNKSVSTLLRKAIDENALEEAVWDEEKETFEYGTLTHEKEKGIAKEQSPNPLLVQPQPGPITMQSFDTQIHFKQTNRSSLFVQDKEEEAEHEAYVQQGELLHFLLSHIETADDVKPQIARLVSEGIISSEESASKIQKLMEGALNRNPATEWFSGKYELFNECTILYKEGETLQQRRPDRVMICDDNVVVVDFKFGRPRPEYQEQVRCYMQLLSQMGYTHINGYLWYVYNNQTEEVK